MGAKLQRLYYSKVSVPSYPSNIHSSPSSEDHWKNIWKLNVLERTKMFLWRIAANVLPTKDNLSRRMVINDPNCVICNVEVESPCHVFLTCPMAKALWFASCWGLKAGEMNISTPVDIVKLILEPPKALCLTREKWSVSLNMALILEEIWSIRNLAFHSNRPADLPSSILAIQRKSNELSRALARAPPVAISVP